MGRDTPPFQGGALGGQKKSTTPGQELFGRFGSTVDNSSIQLDVTPLVPTSSHPSCYFTNITICIWLRIVNRVIAG